MSKSKSADNEKRFKILLFSPALFTSERYGELAKVGPTCEPLGLAYLASVLREKNYDVTLIDAEPLRFTSSDLKSHLKHHQYDFIGMGFMTPMYLCAKDVIKIIKKTAPKSKLIVGGPHITQMPALTMKENHSIDFGVIGEGEITLVELLDAIINKKDFGTVQGIIYRKGGDLKMTLPRPFINDLDSIPMPARDMLPMEKYVPTPTYYRKLPSYIMLISRGCPYRCVYCSKIFGSTIRYHSVKRIIEEMEELISVYGAKEIIFRDDTFTVNKKLIANLCHEIIKKNIHKKISWMCMTRVNLVDEHILRLMKKAGCWSIHFGVESGTQRLLDLIQKGITLEQVRSAFRLTRKIGIQTKAFFMLGLPTETVEESLATIRFAREIDPDGVQFTITVPYPGTKLYEIAKNDGTLKSFKWEDYQTWAGWTNKHLVYIASNRQEQELKDLQKRALIDFYLRPKIIFRIIKNNLRSYSAFEKMMYGGFTLLKNKIRIFGSR